MKSVFVTALILVFMGPSLMLEQAAAKAKTKITPTPTPTPMPEKKEAPTREELLLQGQTRATYKDVLEGFKPTADLSPYFSEGKRDQGLDLAILKKEWESGASSRIAKLQSALEKQEAMQRGEIESPELRSSALDLLRLSLLRVRAMGAEQSTLWLQSEGLIWQRVLQNIAFEEATHSSMMWSAEMRGLIWSELLFKLKKHPERVEPARWANEFKGDLMAYPVDRIVISEARTSLPNNALLIANKIGTELQKNPHRSVAVIRKSIRGGAIARLNVLNKIWSDEDVKKMESEMDQISEIRLQLGLRRFIAQNSKRPQDLNEILNEGLIQEIPTCYKTGKAWELMQLGE